MKKSDKKEKKIENPNSKTVKNKEKKNKEKNVPHGTLYLIM